MAAPCPARFRSLAALVFAALLAGCHALGHPFAGDRPPAALLQITDSASVSIAPIVGTPKEVAGKLSAAVARALVKHDIPASSRTTSLDSYQLYGRVFEARPQDGEAAVVALWRLYDAKGHAIGERTTRFAAKESDWASGSMPPIERLAGLSADALVPLLEGAAPAQAAAKGSEEPQVRVAVAKVTGAPGDGGSSLAAAVALVLKRLDLTIVEGDAKADLYVSGDVTVAPVSEGKQHVKIVWRVRRADGAEIGTVGEENDVPQGMLDGPWGDIAYSVAIGAGEGLAQLIARGAPPAKS